MNRKNNICPFKMNGISKIDTYDGVIMLLASGGKWGKSELAREIGCHISSVHSAICTLTAVEPRLVEDDKGRVYFYEAKTRSNRR